MIRIRLDTRGIANVRFAVSPLNELFGLLALLAARPAPNGLAGHWTGIARRAVRSHRLTLLSAFAAPGYVPDFLTPEPAGARSFGDELRLVAATPTHRVRQEIEMIAAGRSAAGLNGRPLPPALVQGLEQGDRALRDAVCAELRTFWEATLAPTWPRLRLALLGELSRISTAQATRGLGGVLGALHPDIGWDGGSLRVRSRFAVDAERVPAMVLMPSVVNPAVIGMIDPIAGKGRRNPLVTYPAGGAAMRLIGPVGDRQPTAPPLGVAKLVGATRASLLVDLIEPRTTSELAERHRLAASAVSYHLGVLYRAGLLSRRVDHGGVPYQLAPPALVLLSAGRRRAADERGDGRAGFEPG